MWEEVIWREFDLEFIGFLNNIISFMRARAGEKSCLSELIQATEIVQPVGLRDIIFQNYDIPTVKIMTFQP